MSHRQIWIRPHALLSHLQPLGIPTLGPLLVDKILGHPLSISGVEAGTGLELFSTLTVSCRDSAVGCLTGFWGVPMNKQKSIYIGPLIRLLEFTLQQSNSKQKILRTAIFVLVTLVLGKGS